MDSQRPLFKPQSLLSAPRRSIGIPNLSGTTLLFTTTSYSFQEHLQTTRLQALIVQTNEITDIATNQDISYINWLDDKRFVCLRSEEDGRTSLLHGRFSSGSKTRQNTTPLQSAGVINAKTSCLKVARISHDRDDFAVVVGAPACGNGRLYNSADAARKSNSSGRLYDKLFVRHWDRYEGSERNSLWYGKLSLTTDGAGGGRCKLSELTNLLAGTNMECPIAPFGGSDQFDVRKDAIIWLAKDPEINPSWNTKCNVYVCGIDSWDPAEGVTANPEIRQIDVEGFNGVAASPVFAPVGNKAAFLMMRRNRYEADKNQILVVTDITASRFEVVRAFCSAEQSPLEGTWDLSPDSICFAAGGESLVVLAEDQGRGRVYFIRGGDVATGDGSPRPLALPGTAVDVRCLVDGRLFVSGSSMIDDSWYAILDVPTAEVTKVHKHNNPLHEPMWFHSNSDDGKRHGIQPSQINSIWTPASNPAITQTIHSWVIKPSAFDKTKKYPVAYLVHGGPHAAWKDAWSTRWNPAVFAEQGYIVIAPNISGSSGYGQAFTDSSFRNWGGDPYRDLVKLFDWVGGNLEGADNERAVALGHSYGGYMINWIQGHDLGRRFRALVCHGGIFSSVGMWSTEELHFHYYEMDGAPWLPESEQLDVSVRRGDVSSSDCQRRWDPSAHLSRWSTPELVVHCEKDYRVPISEGLAVFNVLQARDVPSQFLVFPDENHWILKPENSLVWHKTVLNWMNKHVGLPPFAEQNSDGAES